MSDEGYEMLPEGYGTYTRTMSMTRIFAEKSKQPSENMTLVKKRKLRWFGQSTRSSAQKKTILQGTVRVKGKSGREKKRKTEMWFANFN